MQWIHYTHKKNNEFIKIYKKHIINVNCLSCPTLRRSWPVASLSKSKSSKIHQGELSTAVNKTECYTISCGRSIEWDVWHVVISSVMTGEGISKKKLLHI